MRILLFLLFIFSPSVIADTCFVTDKMKSELKLKYFDKIKVETSLEDSRFLVTIKLPAQIENRDRYTVFLSFDSVENPSFIIPLEVFYDNGNASTWYQIDEDKISKHFVIVGLKDYCAPSITKEVLYK